ncbi:MAG: hypothetical protein ABI621_20020 [Chloroflexota bacterium]
MKQAKYEKIRIFVASPNDVADERSRLSLVIDKLNKGLADYLGIILEMKEWSDVVPNMGRGQQVIFDQIPVVTWDIMIGILWNRYGMPAGGKSPTESGTHEEFNAAYESWHETGKPRIMFYRCVRPVKESLLTDSNAKKQIDTFFKEFETGGKNQGLYRTYDSQEEFERLIRDHIEKLLVEFHSNKKRKASSKKVLLKSNQDDGINKVTNQEEIDVTSPLLIGMVVDFSQPMANLVTELSENDPSITKRATQAIESFIEGANKYCQAPKSKEEILPRFRFFLYGYGLGNVNYTINSIFAELLSAKNAPKESGVVRDLFAEVAEAKGLPITPNASELHRNWNVYGEAINQQLSDIGREDPSLELALEIANARFIDEMKKPHYKYPLLLILSQGETEEKNSEKILGVCDSMKSIGIEIATGYIGKKSILQNRSLYSQDQPEWTEGARRLFYCSSEMKHENILTKSISRMAIKKSWKVPESARLFLQVNQEEMLDELIDILTSPLKSNRKTN